jgi:hypothetical protein
MHTDITQRDFIWKYTIRSQWGKKTIIHASQMLRITLQQLKIKANDSFNKKLRMKKMDHKILANSDQWKNIWVPKPKTQSIRLNLMGAMKPASVRLKSRTDYPNHL